LTTQYGTSPGGGQAQGPTIATSTVHENLKWDHYNFAPPDGMAVGLKADDRRWRYVRAPGVGTCERGRIRRIARVGRPWAVSCRHRGVRGIRPG
jgi:hypothetical protein